MAPKVVMKVKQVAAPKAARVSKKTTKTVTKGKKLSVLCSLKPAEVAATRSKAVAVATKAKVKVPAQKVVVKVRRVLKQLSAKKAMKAMKAEKSVRHSKKLAMKTKSTDKAALKAKRETLRVNAEKKKATLKAKKEEKKAKIAERKAAKKAKVEEKKAASKEAERGKKEAEREKKAAEREAWETERAIELVALAEAKEKAKAEKAAAAKTMKAAKEQHAKDRESARQAMLLEKKRADEETQRLRAEFKAANPTAKAPPQEATNQDMEEDETPVSEKDWVDMSAEEQAAVTSLGWTRESWTEGKEEPFARCWEVLTAAQKQSARLLGFSPSDFAAAAEEAEPAAPATEPIRASAVMTVTTTPTPLQPDPKAVMEVTLPGQAVKASEERDIEEDNKSGAGRAGDEDGAESQPDAMQVDKSAAKATSDGQEESQHGEADEEQE